MALRRRSSLAARPLVVNVPRDKLRESHLAPFQGISGGRAHRQTRSYVDARQHLASGSFRVQRDALGTTWSLSLAARGSLLWRTKAAPGNHRRCAHLVGARTRFLG